MSTDYTRYVIKVRAIEKLRKEATKWHGIASNLAPRHKYYEIRIITRVRPITSGWVGLHLLGADKAAR